MLCGQSITDGQCGQSITDDAAKAEVFNQYFNSVFTDESLSDLCSVKSLLDVQSSVITSVDFLPDDVYQELLQLNVSKACGPDLIPPLLLKRAAEHICVPLSKLFKAFSTDVFLRTAGYHFCN